MKITRLYGDKNGDSVFEDIEVELEDAGDIGSLSQRFLVKEIIFRETGGDYNYGFHNAPQRQFIILLDGEIEIVTSRGEKRKFKSGDIILAEDLYGKGHKTRSIDGNRRRSVFITLGEDDAEVRQDS